MLRRIAYFPLTTSVPSRCLDVAKASLIDSNLRENLVVTWTVPGVCISKQAYMCDVTNHMQSQVYCKLDGDTTTWEDKAKTWMHHLHLLIPSVIPMGLE